MRLQLAHNRRQRVAQCDHPTLAGEGAHLAYVVHVDDGVVVNTLELRSASRCSIALRDCVARKRCRAVMIQSSSLSAWNARPRERPAGGIPRRFGPQNCGWWLDLRLRPKPRFWPDSRQLLPSGMRLGIRLKAFPKPLRASGLSDGLRSAASKCAMASSRRPACSKALPRLDCALFGIGREPRGDFVLGDRVVI